jgi:SAM-dependent methyltransferase
MIDHAQSIGTSRPVRWQQADAMKLPFQDASFDLVVCQFGAMFFPDKPAAYAETRRVIEPGGRFVFSVWDAIGENEFTDVAVNALAKLFPRNPPRFLARTPHGYHERSLIAAHLDAGGFSAPAGIETVGARSRAASARIAAAGLCEGTPMRPEIEAFGPQALQAATNAAAEAIAAQFGDGEIDGKIQALIVTLQR